MIAYDRVKKGGMLRNSGSSFDFDKLYPVGSLFSTIDDTFDPNSAPGWQGTWVKISGNYYFKTLDPNDPDESSGSYYSTTKNITTSSHQLTINEIPEHNHNVGTLTTSTNGSHNHTATSNVSDTGDEGTHMHQAKVSTGAWLAGSTPSVAVDLPWYRFNDAKGFDTAYLNDYFTGTYADFQEEGLNVNQSRLRSGAHTHNIITTVTSNGDHYHNVSGNTGYEGHDQGHDHTVTLTNLKPNYVAIIVWKRTA